MNSNWNSEPLGNLVGYIARGIAPKYTDESNENAVVVLGQRCVRNQQIDYSQARLHDSSSKNVKPEKLVRLNDILINATGVGSAGRVAQVTDIPPYGCLTDSHVLTLRADGINPLYLGYFVKSKQSIIEGMAEGSTGQTEMNKARLSTEVVVTFPSDPETQEAIASFLLAMDRKIANNYRTNDYLSDMLDALFDEVVTGESFDWESASLLDIANYKNGLAMQRFRPVGNDRGLPVLKIRELGQGYCGADAERCRSDIDEAVTIHDGDLVFSWSGTLLLDFWAGGDAGLNQHLFKVTSCSYPSWFYYMWTKQHMRRFISLAKDRATTMGHIKRSALQESEVFIPPSDRMEELTAQMQPIVDEIIELKVQSRKLGELRDALLPKLMAGEIDTAKIELDDARTPR